MIASKGSERRAATAEGKRATTAAIRQERDAVNTAAIKASVEESRRLSLAKTDKLRELRLAKEAADAKAAVKPAKPASAKDKAAAAAQEAAAPGKAAPEKAAKEKPAKVSKARAKSAASA